jgi:hypothetical protein
MKAWSIKVGGRSYTSFLHTNWELSDSIPVTGNCEAYPGMWPHALYVSRKAARAAVKRLQPIHPFKLTVVAVTIEEVL